jgi:hypothetical protein
MLAVQELPWFHHHLRPIILILILPLLPHHTMPISSILAVAMCLVAHHIWALSKDIIRNRICISTIRSYYRPLSHSLSLSLLGPMYAPSFLSHFIC